MEVPIELIQLWFLLTMEDEKYIFLRRGVDFKWFKALRNVSVKYIDIFFEIMHL